MATANLLQTSVSGGTQNALSLQGDGVFFPKASTTSRLALTLGTTDKGFIVYDTTDNNIYFWNGTAWESVPSSGDAGGNGSVQYNDNGIVSGATNFVWDKVNGRVGIGTASPTYTLDVSSTSNIVGRVSSSSVLNTGFSIANTTGSSWTVYSFGSNDATLQNSFGIYHQGGTSFLQITQAGNVGIGVTPAGTGGCLQLKSGITFPATQVASSDANTLDDYEEGTFTPTIVGATTAGVGTYTTQAGYYTKVGNLVTASVFLGWTAHTGTGNMYFAGLPFAASSSASYHSAASISYVNNIALTASNVLTLFITPGASSLEASQYPVGGGGATNVPVDVSGNIIYTVTYRV